MYCLSLLYFDSMTISCAGLPFDFRLIAPWLFLLGLKLSRPDSIGPSVYTESFAQLPSTNSRCLLEPLERLLLEALFAGTALLKSMLNKIMFKSLLPKNQIVSILSPGRRVILWYSFYLRAFVSEWSSLIVCCYMTQWVPLTNRTRNLSWLRSDGIRS